MLEFMIRLTSVVWTYIPAPVNVRTMRDVYMILLLSLPVESIFRINGFLQR